MKKSDNKLYWLWLAERFGVASKQFATFAYTFRDPFDVYDMTDDEIEHIEGISRQTKDALCDKSLDNAYSILKYCRENKIDIVDFYSEKYPERLRIIENPPVLLYCKGNLPDMNSKLCIAAVGTRKISEYGRQSAYKISYELASAGVCVVSGMALGVDGVCAVGALEAHGCTVAVLGCGLGRVYPKEHDMLMRKIIKSGAVVSEYPPSTPPCAENFPVRNRIISGMCQGTLVVEAAQRSGALITASKAISQGRDVFALPGKIDDSRSRGPNDLIRDGANITLSASDIISHYDFLYHSAIDYAALTRAKLRSDLKDSVLSSYGVCGSDARKSIVRSKKQQNTDAYEMHDKAEAERTVVSEPPKTNNDQAYNMLDEKTRRVYDMIGNEPFSPDLLVSSGDAVGDVITALTLLEISGLIVSCPGGMFRKI